MPDLSELKNAIMTGNAKAAEDITKEALSGGVDPQEIVNKHMIPAMDEVGKKFECNDIFVPELLIAARAMKAALELIRPKLVEAGAESAGRVVIGTVKGDLHDIGKNLVASMLEGGGFEVIDLGVDVSPEKFAQTVKENNVKVVALSALLTTTMPAMKDTIDALTNSGVREQVKVIVGGAPVTQQFADEIKADGYSDNANGAVGVVRQLLG